MSQEFLKKVYDRYESQDFVFGQDNLNPMREIKPISDEDKDVNEILATIQARINAVRENMNLPKSGNLESGTRKEDEIINGYPTNGDSLAPGKTQAQLGSMALMGTDLGDSSLFGDGLGDGSDNPLVKEIDDLMMQIGAALADYDYDDGSGSGDGTDGGPGGGGGKPSKGKTNKPGAQDSIRSLSKSSLLVVDCSNYNTLNKDPCGDLANPADNKDGNGNNGNGGAGSGSGSGDGSDSGSGDGPNNNTDEGLDTAVNSQEQDIAAATVQDLMCALMELVFLKIILKLLEVSNIIAKVCSLAMKTAYTIIEAAQLAAGAWLNPTNLGKIAQIIVGRVMAVLQQAMAKIIQMLWDMLNLECIADVTLDTIDAINKTLTGVTQTINGVKTDSIALKNLGQDTLNTLKEAQENLTRMLSKDAIKEQAQLFVDEFKNATKEGLEETKKKALEKVKEVTKYEKFKKGGQSIAQNVASLGVAIESLDTLPEELGF